MSDPVDSVPPISGDRASPAHQASSDAAKPTADEAARAGWSQIGRPRRVASFIALSLGWLFALIGLIVLAVLWFDGSYMRDPSIHRMLTAPDMDAVSTSIGVMAGWGFTGIVAMLFGWIAYRASRRTRGQSLVIVGSLILLLAAVGSLRPSRAGRGFAAGTPEARRAGQDLVDMVNRIMPNDGSLPRDIGSGRASAAVHGDWAVLVSVMERYMGGVQRALVEFQTQTSALHLERLLAPERLDTPEELAESRAKVTSALGLIEEYSHAAPRLVREAIEAINASELTAATKQEMTRNFQQGVALSMPAFDLNLEYEREMFAEYDGILELFQSRQGMYKVESDQVLFDDPADAGTYNASIRRASAISDKQRSLQIAMEDAARVRMNEMKRTTGAGAAVTRTPIVPVRTGPTITLDAAGITINDKPVSLPISEASLHELLGGPPSRRMGEDESIRIWDSVGIVASSPGPSKGIDVILMRLNRHQRFEEYPENEFAGTITLAGTKVRPIDTPRSLNRILKDHAFQCVDDEDNAWEIEFPGFIVTMDSDADGLSEAISFRAPEPEDKHPAQEEQGRPPRF